MGKILALVSKKKKKRKKTLKKYKVSKCFFKEQDTNWFI